MKTTKHKVTKKDLETNRFMKEDKLKVGDVIEIAVPEKKTIKAKPKAVVIEPNSPYFLTGNGIKLPLEIEGHVVEQMVETKEVNGVTYYSCLCDDGCTYDAVEVA